MTWTTTTTGVVWQPPTDVYETAADFVVRVEVGGIDPDQVEISLSDRVVSIAGLRKDPAPKVGYHRMEIFYGPFLTRAILPRRVDASHIQAQYRDGFLTVVVPKASPVRVRVGSGEADETQAEGK
ncbi:MAG: Hsp20/alpha crystallin family protein [Anaerolineae bacterium]